MGFKEKLFSYGYLVLFILKISVYIVQGPIRAHVSGFWLHGFCDLNTSIKAFSMI